MTDPFATFKPSFVGDMPIFVGSRLHPQDQAAGVGVGSQGPALLWQAAAWLASWQSALGLGCGNMLRCAWQILDSVSF